MFIRVIFRRGARVPLGFIVREAMQKMGYPIHERYYPVKHWEESIRMMHEGFKFVPKCVDRRLPNHV